MRRILSRHGAIGNEARAGGAGGPSHSHANSSTSAQPTCNHPTAHPTTTSPQGFDECHTIDEWKSFFEAMATLAVIMLMVVRAVESATGKRPSFVLLSATPRAEPMARLCSQLGLQKGERCCCGTP